MDSELRKKALKYFERNEVFCSQHISPQWPHLSIQGKIEFLKRSKESTFPFTNAEQYFIFEFFEWARQYLHSYDSHEDKPGAFACLLLDKPERILALMEEEKKRGLEYEATLKGFRIVNPLGNTEMRTHYGQMYFDEIRIMEEHSTFYANIRNKDKLQLLRDISRPDDVEPLFFLNQLDRLEKTYHLGMNAIQRWREKPYSDIAEVNTKAYEYKVNAFLHWVRAKQATDPKQQRDHASKAWRFFDKLIGRGSSVLQYALFSYRLYSLWLRIEFDLDNEIIMEFLKYFKHLVRGYAPAWEKVKDIEPNPNWKSPIMEKREEEYYTHMRRAAEEIDATSYPDFLPGLMTQES